MPISLLCWRRCSEKIFCWYLKWYIIKVNKLSNNRTIQLRFWFVHFLYIARFQISPWESLYVFSTRIKAVLPLFVLKVFIQTLSWFIFWQYPHLYFRFAKYSLISYMDRHYSSMKSKSSFENVSASPFFSFISLSWIRVCSLYMPCILSCYLRWIMSIHKYRYSSEQGSWSFFWWRRNQPGRSPYLFWTYSCWYSW